MHVENNWTFSFQNVLIEIFIVTLLEKSIFSKHFRFDLSAVAGRTFWFIWLCVPCRWHLKPSLLLFRRLRLGLLLSAKELVRRVVVSNVTEVLCHGNNETTNNQNRQDGRVFAYEATLFEMSVNTGSPQCNFNPFIAQPTHLSSTWFPSQLWKSIEHRHTPAPADRLHTLRRHPHELLSLRRFDCWKTWVILPPHAVVRRRPTTQLSMPQTLPRLPWTSHYCSWLRRQPFSAVRDCLFQFCWWIMGKKSSQPLVRHLCTLKDITTKSASAFSQFLTCQKVSLINIYVLGVYASTAKRNESKRKAIFMVKVSLTKPKMIRIR